MVREFSPAPTNEIFRIKNLNNRTAKITNFKKQISNKSQKTKIKLQKQLEAIDLSPRSF